MSRGREIALIMACTLYLSAMVAVAVIYFEERGAGWFIAVTWAPVLWFVYRIGAGRRQWKPPSKPITRKESELRRQASIEEFERKRQALIEEIRPDPKLARLIPLLEHRLMTLDEIRHRSQRIDEISAVPHRTAYVRSILQGDDPTDEQIDFLVFPDRPALCSHLAPLELAIRAAGYHARLTGPRSVEAVLQWRLPLDRLPPCVVPESFEYTIDRDRYDLTRLRCTVCNDSIEETVHGPLWPPTSPWPPATP